MERERRLENTELAVRSFVVSLTSPKEIYKRFVGSREEGGREEPYVLTFYIGLKRDQEKGWRYTLLGGKIKDGEKFPEAIQREINKEGNFGFLGIRGPTDIGGWRYSSGKSGPRRVILTYTPVLLINKKVDIGNGINEKIVGLNIDQFTQLVREGVLNGIPLEGHLAITDQPLDEIEILQEDKKKRNSAMTRGIKWMRHIERYLREKFENLIILPEGEFYQEYQKILSSFMRRGLEVSIRRKTLPEFQERVERRLIEALNGGFLGKDILYYLPHLAKEGLDWSGLPEATEGVKSFVSFLRDIFTQFLSEMSKEEDYREKLSSETTSLEDKYQAVSLLNDFFRKRLKEVFGATDVDLDKALSYISSFFRELSSEMKVADPNLTQGLYQDFVLLDEVNSANYGRLLSLFLGYDTKKNPKDKELLIRFEAGRHLFLLLKTLGSMKYYERQIKKIREGRLRLALDNFFGPIVDEQIIELNNGMQMRLRVREGRDSQIRIVDEKPLKPFSSFLRKTFEEEPSEIRDFYSISLVLCQEEVGDFSLDIYGKTITDLVNYLKDQFPDKKVWADELDMYGSEDFINNKKIAVEGKRTGSQSKRMVRAKTFIYIGDECVELVIYPFLRIEESDYWGWLEKITDDRDYVVKRLLAGRNGIPPLYDLFFPPSLYPIHYQHKLKANYHQ